VDLLGTVDGVPGRAPPCCSRWPVHHLAAVRLQMPVLMERQPLAFASLPLPLQRFSTRRIIPSVVLSGGKQVATNGCTACLRFELYIRFDRAHKDCKNASRSALGFHGFVVAGSMPAFFQNACMASRFICRLIVM
jgi:hypothetical protein